MSFLQLPSPILLLIGAVIIWLGIRLIISNGSGGLRDLFKREAARTRRGLGIKAITSLIDDTKIWVRSSDDCHSLILFGEFASEKAEISSTVFFGITCKDPNNYLSLESILQWPYPKNNHPYKNHKVEILEDKEDEKATEIVHFIELRGAPLIELHFFSYLGDVLPKSLRVEAENGKFIIEDPKGNAKIFT